MYNYYIYIYIRARIRDQSGLGRGDHVIVGVVAIQSVKHLFHVFQFAARTPPRRSVRRNRSSHGGRSGRMMGGRHRPRVQPRRRRFATPLLLRSSPTRRRGRLRGARGVGYLRRPGRPEADSPRRHRRRRARGFDGGARGVRCEPGSVVVVAAEDWSSDAVQMLGRQKRRGMCSSTSSTDYDEAITQRPTAARAPESGQVGRVQPGVERHLAAEHPRRVKVKGRRRCRSRRQIRLRQVMVVDFRQGGGG